MLTYLYLIGLIFSLGFKAGSFWAGPETLKGKKGVIPSENLLNVFFVLLWATFWPLAWLDVLLTKFSQKYARSLARRRYLKGPV